MLKIGGCIIAESERGEASDICVSSLPLITCGLSQRSSVTASSISDDGFLYCIQRGFFTKGGDPVVPQEFKIHWKERRSDIYPCLAFVTALLISGLSPDNISKELVL